MPELPEIEFSDTRSAATAWFYALNYEPNQDEDSLKALLAECYPKANIDVVQAIVKRRQPFENITNDLVEEVLECTHSDGYEILPWREAVMKVLIIDMLSNLKSPSVQIIEDAILRTTSMLEDRLRGTTKNATQLISGQRSRLRKSVRSVILASLYQKHYRKELPPETIQSAMMELVKPCMDPDFIVDEFPFEGYYSKKDGFSVRGLFIFCEATRFVRSIASHIEELDELIQKSSKRWRVARMAQVDLNILRMAAYELTIEYTSPPRILINEAVELAKIFGAEQSKNFVNGILQQLCNDNRISV